LWDATQHGTFSSCTLYQRVTAASGTTPTLNTFLQDSPDNVGFSDRISLPQATAASSVFGVIPVLTAPSLAPLANGALATTDGALAAGSVVAGQLAPFGRIKFVRTGTTPSFTVVYAVMCK
jgi:hypothetical protein